MARRVGLLFDLDGTLIDSALTILAIINAIRIERSANPIGMEDIRPHLSKGGAALVKASLAEACQDPEGDLVLFRERYAIVPQGPEIVFKEVKRSLKHIRSLGYPMAVCTNKPTLLASRALEQTGLAQFFDAIVAHDVGKAAKPDPALLYDACAQLDVDPEKSALIGDSEADAGAARAARMCFIFAGYGYPVGDPELIARHFSIMCPSELPSVLATALETAQPRVAA